MTQDIRKALNILLEAMSPEEKKERDRQRRVEKAMAKIEEFNSLLDKAKNIQVKSWASFPDYEDWEPTGTYSGGSADPIFTDEYNDLSGNLADIGRKTVELTKYKVPVDRDLEWFREVVKDLETYGFAEFDYGWFEDEVAIRMEKQ